MIALLDNRLWQFSSQCFKLTSFALPRTRRGYAFAKFLLPSMVVALLFHFVGTRSLSAADDGLRVREDEKKRDDVVWLMDEPGFRPNLAPAIWHALVWQGIAFGGLSAMESDHTNFEEPSFRNIRRAFERGPLWENDQWYWNYVAHPLWGSETYLRARAQGFGRFPSFLFSTACSVVWEFCFEGWVSRPSYDDLLITSTTGSLIGELRFHIKRKLALSESKAAKVLDFFLDPLHGVSRAVGGWFGQDWREPAFTRVSTEERGDPFITLQPALIEKKPGVLIQMSRSF